MSTTPTVDYAHTADAERNRIVKARKIARWAYDRNLPPADLAATVRLGDMAQLREWAHGADVTVPGSMATWQAAIDALTELEAWAADPKNATHPRAARQVPTEPETFTEVPASLAPVVPLRPAAAVAGIVIPRGWEAAVAAGPIMRRDAVCARCGMPAITACPVVDARAEWRCAAHPPQPGEWGARLDWTPRPDADLQWHPDGPHRCFNPRCPHYRLNQGTTPIAASAPLDERAAANGKNRAPVHVRQAAREAEERRKAREKEIRSR